MKGGSLSSGFGDGDCRRCRGKARIKRIHPPRPPFTTKGNRPPSNHNRLFCETCFCWLSSWGKQKGV